ncbi:MAG: sulfatase [Gemmatimonadales bacterium]
MKASLISALLLMSMLIARSGLGADRPNIVLMLSDDQSWYGLSVQMHPDMPNSKSDFYHTPRLEELASQGMRFSAAYAPATVCSPTRMSLQSGMSPAKNHWTKAAGIATASANYPLIPVQHRKVIEEEEITIGEVLQTAGYTTAHYGKWHLFGGGPAKHGYDESDGETANRNADPLNAPDNPLDVIGMSERALDFMRRADEADQPFFVQISYYPLHVPENASPETIARVEARPEGEIHSRVLKAAITEDLDTGVGVIMDGVERLGLSDNTYVIYMGDNGHNPGDNNVHNSLTDNPVPLIGAKGNVSEGGIRVPFIIKGPGIEANSWSHVPIVGYDLFPTYAEWAEIDADALPEGIEGGSIVSVLDSGGAGDIDRPEEGLVFHFPHYQAGNPQSAILLGDYKLIKYYEGSKTVLFDLSTDLGERHNLATKMPGKAAELEARLDAYLESVDADIPVVNRNYDSARPSGIRGTRRDPNELRIDDPAVDPKRLYYPES